MGVDKALRPLFALSTDELKEMSLDKCFKHILANPTWRPVFEFYCCSLYAEENLAFWDAVEAWKLKPTLEVAHYITNTYIRENSEHQVNISFSSLDQFLQQMEELLHDNREITTDLFEKPQNEIYGLILSSLMQPFHGKLAEVKQKYEERRKQIIPMESMKLGLQQHIADTKDHHIKKALWKKKVKADLDSLDRIQKKISTLQENIRAQQEIYSSVSNCLDKDISMEYSISCLLEGIQPNHVLTRNDMPVELVSKTFQALDSLVSLEHADYPFIGCSYTEIDVNINRLVLQTEEAVSAMTEQSEKQDQRCKLFSRSATLLDEMITKSNKGKDITTSKQLIDELNQITKEIPGQLQDKHLFSQHIIDLVNRDPPISEEGTFIDAEEYLDFIITSKERQKFDSYFMTYRNFSNPMALLRQLQIRYCVLPMDEKIDYDLVIEFRRDVLCFVHHWIRHFFVDCATIQEHLSSFLIYIAHPSDNELVEKILHSFNLGIETKAKVVKEPFDFSTIASDQVVTCHLYHAQPQHFAEQITLFHTSLSSTIPLYELIQRETTKNSRVFTDAYLNHFQSLVRWFVRQILAHTKRMERAIVIDKMVVIMTLCYQMKNYTAVFAILFALNSENIYYLADLWTRLSQAKRFTFFLFSHFFYSDYLLYHAEVNSSVVDSSQDEFDDFSDPCVLFLPPLLSQLSNLETKASSIRRADGTIDIHRCKDMYSKIELIMSCKIASYPFEVDSKMQEFFMSKLMIFRDAVPLDTANPILPKDICDKLQFSPLSDLDLQAEFKRYRFTAVDILFMPAMVKKSTALDRFGMRNLSKRVWTQSFDGERSNEQNFTAVQPWRRPTGTYDTAQIIKAMKKKDAGITVREEMLPDGSAVKVFSDSDLNEWLRIMIASGYAKLSELKRVEQALFDSGFIQVIPGSTPPLYSLNRAPISCGNLKTRKSSFVIKKSRSDSAFTSGEYLSRIVIMMKDPVDGLSLKSRKGMFRKFTNCFVGDKAVSWMLEHGIPDRKTAVDTGEAILQEGYIQHVTNDHGFKDGKFYYKFIK